MHAVTVCVCQTLLKKLLSYLLEFIFDLKPISLITPIHRVAETTPSRAVLH